ncbi:MAG: DUF2520 domain-containing protein [Acidobacteriota bacterium]|nr:DUF2520 domain-containing protein [Acidobacteriota bacterium]
MGRTFVGRIPALASRLGPVCSTSFRLAARISNALRAGTPERNFAALESVDLLLVCAPAPAFCSLVDSGFLTDIDWRNKTVLVCDSTILSGDIPLPRDCGAAVASLNPVPGLPNCFATEGDHQAVRIARLLATALGGKAHHFPPERMLLYKAALSLTNSLFTPLIEGTVECLRQSGMPTREATRLAEALLKESLRAYRHSGRKSWSGPVASGDRGAVERQYLAIAADKPLLASYFRNAAEFAFDLYRTFPELTRYDKARFSRSGKGPCS